MTESSKRFRVACSFAGEKRDFVQQVAALLAERFEEAKILYDQYHEAEFARDELDAHLTGLYRDHSDLIVVVLCRNYEWKEWCGLEWKSIRGLLKQRKKDGILLTRFDRMEAEILEGLAGFIELDGKKPRWLDRGERQRQAARRTVHAASTGPRWLDRGKCA
jgi:hypothetical protein